LRRNLSKFIRQTGLYCSKQLETTFHQFCDKPLHIIFKVIENSTTSLLVSGLYVSIMQFPRYYHLHYM